MKRSVFFSLFLSIAFIAFGSTTVFAQEPISDEKLKLIKLLQKYASIRSINLKIELSFGDVEKDFNSLFEQDAAFTVEQKAQLKKDASAAILKIGNAFKSNDENISSISEFSGKRFLEILDKTFTLEELKSIIAFYETPAGQKLSAFLPNIDTTIAKEIKASLTAKLQEMMNPLIAAEKTAFEQRLKELKAKK